MNLETYLETNNFEKKDLTILFSVGCVLNTKTGDTFPIMADDGFDFEDGMNVVTDEFDEYWWENLGKWKADERLSLDLVCHRTGGAPVFSSRLLCRLPCTRPCLPVLRQRVIVQLYFWCQCLYSPLALCLHCLNFV